MSDRGGGIRRVLHGRRRGKRPRPGRAALVRDLLPRLRIDLQGVAPGTLDPRTLFAPPRPAVWLEIGFGGGEHLAWQAEAGAAVGLIGCEPYQAGMARLIGHLAERRLDNVRVLDDDARLLLQALAPSSIARAFLLFPDPWPKRRHNKRRFVGPANVAAMARVLADGAEFRLATDDLDYCRWMLAHLAAHPDFEWLAEGPGDWRRRTADWPVTRYEEKALAAGRRCVYLRFRRRRRESP